MKSIEVIMVNDGSTDDSKKIAEIFENRNAAFFLVNRTNGGLSAARNTGIERAKGKYIYFLDGDDFLADDALEKLYVRAENDRLDVILFSAYTFEDGSTKYDWNEDKGYTGYYPNIYKGLDICQNILDNNDYNPSSCLMFSRGALIQDHKLRFLEGIINEDNLFFFELLSLSERVAVMNEPLYYRRYRIGSITQTRDWSNTIQSMCLSIEAADVFIENHPQIKGKCCDSMMSFFIYYMLSAWNSLPRNKQYSSEIRGLFKRVKPLVRKYEKGKSRSLALFFFCMPLYKLHELIENKNVLRNS